MKKLIRITLLSAALAALLCTGAFAAEDTPSGIYDISETESSAKIEAIGADRLSVTYDSAVAGNYYLLIVQKDDGSNLPTQSNIYYIDQKTAEDTSVTFDVYPRAMPSGSYKIYMSDSGDALAGLEAVGSFKYYTTASKVVNLTDLAEYDEEAEREAYYKLDGNTLTVTKDKACVVLWTEDEFESEDDVKADDVSSKWERITATATNNKKVYTFDLGGKTGGTVVIAVKGDFNQDGAINAEDYGALVAVSLEERQINSTIKAICDIEVDGTIDASDYGALVAVSLEERVLDW